MRSEYLLSSRFAERQNVFRLRFLGGRRKMVEHCPLRDVVADLLAEALCSQIILRQSLHERFLIGKLRHDLPDSLFHGFLVGRKVEAVRFTEDQMLQQHEFFHDAFSESAGFFRIAQNTELHRSKLDLLLEGLRREGVCSKFGGYDDRKRGIRQRFAHGILHITGLCGCFFAGSACREQEQQAKRCCGSKKCWKRRDERLDGSVHG